MILKKHIQGVLKWGVVMAVHIVITGMMASCEKEENTNLIPADLPRFDEIKQQYQDILTSAEYGWKTEYQPSLSTGIFRIYMQFKEDGTVEIESDMYGYQQSNSEIYYSISGATFPELVFQTFSVWHQIYEVADGHFQFRILDIDSNRVELGDVNGDPGGTSVILTKSSEQDRRLLENTNDIVEMVHNFYDNTENYFKVLEFKEINFSGLATFDFDRHQLILNYINNAGQTQISFINFSYDENGIQFISNFSIHETEIKRFNLNIHTDSTILVQTSELNEGLLYSTDLPEFEFTGALDLFSDYSFFYIQGFSPALDSLDSEIQSAGSFTGVQIYQDHILNYSSRFNALTFIIYDEQLEYDFYHFYIEQFQKLGEDELRFHWSNTYSNNIDNDLFAILRDFILFFFNKNGFKVIPTGSTFTFVSRGNPKQYFVVVPVS